MAPTPLEQPFDHMAARAFSFFPAIVGIEHNEWLLKQVTWSEVLVANDKSDLELWIPRRYFGEASRTEDPVLIVGLSRELEYQGGMLRPYKPRILKMPPSRADTLATPGAASHEPSTIMGVRLELEDRRVLKFMGIAVACFVVACVLVVAVLRLGMVSPRIKILARDQAYAQLTGRDDHFAVVTKLGKPGFDRFKEIGTIQYEALTYPARKFTVILMGTDVRTVTYIGVLDDNWKPVDAVNIRSGGSYRDLLGTLPRF
jgi:hypothetical protein